MRKNWYESRSLWIAIFQGIAGVLVIFFAENPEFAVVGVGATVKSFLDMYLRYTTNKEIR